MVYTLTIGLSAFLLFLVQPLISKMLLPWFGGGASIWITSLVFFQTLLLVGYGSTHFLVRKLGLRRHLIFTIALLVLSLLSLPIRAHLGVAEDWPPSLALFTLLLWSVGLPYLVLTTTSPIVQYWIANDSRTQTQSPYVQYGISNLGSLGGLLAYPFAVELLLTNPAQSWFWTALYVVYGLLLVSCIGLFLKHNPPSAPLPAPPAALTTRAASLGRDVRVKWIFQAMVPSSLLLVVTHYLTLDVVNFPLLWVAPLCLYLTTFILCFLVPRLSTPGNLRTFVGVVAILFLLIANHGYYNFGFEVKLTAALVCLFVVCMIFHGDLERGKPDKQDLTDFYLQVSAGGCLGSILAGIIAPLIFVSTFEFYIVLVIALYYVVVSYFPLRPNVTWLFRGAVALSLTVSWISNETVLTGGETLYRDRSFYSTYAVREQGEPITFRRLVAGTHVHGAQIVGEPRTPISYYHAATGIGSIYNLQHPHRVGAIGLGIGAIAAYANEGDQYDLFELDPMVIDIANHWFTVLPSTKAQLNYFVGDGRIRMRSAPEGEYDLFVLDAFTSGSIPTHLVTLEAISEIIGKLNPDGLIAYHISNQHIDLLPVLNAIAHELDIGILFHESTENAKMNEYPAVWVALARDRAVLARLEKDSSRWREPPPEALLWRDDYSNIWSVLK